ncbi:MAG: hypothetical protein WC895_02755 [Candidatus Shapirobacteria bacterium]|jgi:hypothetical protein
MKPYFNNPYEDLKDSYGSKLFPFHDLLKDYSDLIKPNLNDDKILHRYSFPVQMLTDCLSHAHEYGSKIEVRKKVEVAMDLINSAFRKNPELVTKTFEIVSDSMSDYDEEVHDTEMNYHKTRNKEHSYIQQFKAMFNLYKEIYSDYYSIISTLPTISKEIVFGTFDVNTNITDYLKKETKYKKEKLDTPIILNKQPINLLIDGSDQHIRNSLSHEHRHVFNDDKETVLLTDINGRGNETYRHVFNLDEFEKKLHSLYTTVLSMRMALIILNTNEVKNMQPYFSNTTLTPKKIEKVAYVCAKDSFLDFESMKLNSNENIEFVVKKQDRKSGEYYVGVGPFVKKVEIPSIPIAEQQLSRFLQETHFFTGKIFKKMKVTLVDLNNNVIGYIETDSLNFLNKTADDFLKGVITNTIPSGYPLQ